MSLIKYLDAFPILLGENYIAPGAYLIGAVTLGEDTSVFFNSVLRADINSIKIGSHCNIQDNCTFHVSNTFGVNLGDYVTIGHQVLLHACIIGDNCTVGMGSVVMDGAEVDDDCIVAAGSLITKGKYFPPRSLIMGSPAVKVRKLTDDEVEQNKAMALKYVGIKNNYIVQP
jgi:carbonic anhydrase/acetyltransferase-like protein (isoleucine patch superfamily)